MDFEVFYPFKLPVKVLQITGFWNTRKSAWPYFLYGIFMHVVFIDLFIILQVAYLFTFETFLDFVNVLTMLPSYISFCAKSINLLYNFSEIEKLFAMIQENVDGKSMSDKFNRRLRRVDKICKWFVASGVMNCVFGSLVPFLTHELPLRMWYPFTYDSNRVMFWIGSWYQIADAIVSPNDIVLDVFPVLFMAYILAMLEELCEQLEKLTVRKSINPDGSVNQSEHIDNSVELLMCINYQRKIIAIAKKTQDSFSLVLLVQGAMSTLILCTTSFALTVVGFKLQY